MSLWTCSTHGLTGPAACCSKSVRCTNTGESAVTDAPRQDAPDARERLTVALAAWLRVELGATGPARSRDWAERILRYLDYFDASPLRERAPSEPDLCPWCDNALALHEPNGMAGTPPHYREGCKLLAAPEREVREALMQVRDLALGAALRDDHLMHVEVLARALAPHAPEPGTEECNECGGRRYVYGGDDGGQPCPGCDATGRMRKGSSLVVAEARAVMPEMERQEREAATAVLHEAERNYTELVEALQLVAKERGLTDEEIAEAGDDATADEYVRALFPATPPQRAGVTERGTDAEPPELHGSYAAKIVLELVRDGEFMGSLAADAQATVAALNEALTWVAAEYEKVRAASRVAPQGGET